MDADKGTSTGRRRLRKVPSSKQKASSARKTRAKKNSAAARKKKRKAAEKKEATRRLSARFFSRLAKNIRGTHMWGTKTTGKICWIAGAPNPWCGCDRPDPVMDLGIPVNTPSRPLRQGDLPSNTPCPGPPPSHRGTPQDLQANPPRLVPPPSHRGIP